MKMKIKKEILQKFINFVSLCKKQDLNIGDKLNEMMSIEIKEFNITNKAK